jgi:uncharacterized caspase-like protein
LKAGAIISRVTRWALVPLACLLFFEAAQAAERRVALVIGNSAYKDAPLVNPGNDARLISQVLREAGFTVLERRNLNQAGLRRAIREFGDEIAKGGVGLFYYAGHGMQVKGRNYMIPVGHDIRREDEVAEQSVEVGLVMEKLTSAKNRPNIVILDACRNNPYGGAGGLAPMDAPAGTLIAFATAPGQLAADGDGDNSTYTKHLAGYMREPGIKIEDVFKRTRAAVRQESAGRQVPWENTSLEGDFYFKAQDPAVIAAQEREREEAQKEAIARAVQEALKRSRGDQEKIEREIAQRVAAERAAAERAAAERIAAIERAAQAAIERALRGQPPAQPQAQPVAAAAQPSPVAVLKPQPPAPSKPAAQEPTRVAVAAPAGVMRGMPAASLVPKVGDTWLYLYTERDYGNKKEEKARRRVEAVTDAEIRVRTGGGDVLVYNLDGNLMRREYKSGEVRTWEPFQARFNHPLEPGKTWTHKFVFKRSGREVEHDATYTVVGWEDITVPAGTFKALKITSVSSYRRLDNNFRGQTVVDTWYVPETKRWVKMEVLERGNNGVIYQDWTEELLSFKVQ